MRLVFISSVTAITPLRTISVTTGSIAGLVGVRAALFRLVAIVVPDDLAFGRPREGGDPHAVSSKMGQHGQNNRDETDYRSPPSRGRRRELINRTPSH